MNTCKTCFYWGKGSENEQGPKRTCMSGKIYFGVDPNKTDTLEAGSDGYDYGINTGCDFGCIHHKEMA